VIRLTRRYRFAASHRLHADGLSDEQNRAVYGKCNNPFGHGHDYVLEVSVRGPVDAETGLVVSVPELDRLVSERVLSAVSMRNLNLDVAEFRDLVPTSENLALVVRGRLEEAWTEFFPGLWPELEKVRIQETPRNVFEVFAKRSADRTADRERELVSQK
jgi:6-pyruvoyltetrahydropterin/6-carboxytetrahydropterin synthase